MKNIITFLTILIASSSAFSQITAPQKMSYQAIVRNSSNALVQDSPVGIKISILQGSINGSSVYVETHTAQTNQNGLLDLQIGGGSVVSGAYTNSIYWGSAYFLKTEIDPLGGTNYTITSTSELLSVPVSNFAHVSGISQTSETLFGQSWKFVGAYTQVNQAETDFQLVGYSVMNYLGSDKVSWTIKLDAYDANQDGTIDLNEYGHEYTLYGTVDAVFAYEVTIPSQSAGGEMFPAMIGTLVPTVGGDVLTFTYGDPNGEVIELVKQ
jgi:hypothetical protein